jgi:malonate-semialdehyde dehydrogenase (acetylating)/methylmalonate-semialdehyde dehydrogenase
MGGAKNHGIVLPDADLDQVIKDLSGAAFGSAGERCMALPVVVPVGKKTADELRERMVAEIEHPEGRHLHRRSAPTTARWSPPSTSQDRRLHPHRPRRGRRAGRRRPRLQPAGLREGLLHRPVAVRRRQARDEDLQEEIFGPVLQIVRAESFEEAMACRPKHQYGNGVAIFTRNGRAAREFAARVNVGMVGINVPIPVPVAYHTFGGWKRSAFGDTNQHGMEGVKFYTKVKTVTARWPEGDVGDSSFVIPTMK